MSVYFYEIYEIEIFLTKKRVLKDVIKTHFQKKFFPKYDKTNVFLRYRRENVKNKKRKIDFF
jgi:hypothetical protein